MLGGAIGIAGAQVVMAAVVDADGAAHHGPATVSLAGSVVNPSARCRKGWLFKVAAGESHFFRITTATSDAGRLG